MGVNFGVHFGCFDLFTLPLTRARAYNDCVKDAVLLKTASNRTGHHPQNGPILGSFISA